MRGYADKNAALWKHEGSLRDTIDRYKGQMIPPGELSLRLEQNFSYRIIGVLVPSKTPAREVTGYELSEETESESEIQRRAM